MMLCICQLLALAVQYLEHILLLLVSSPSDLSMRTGTIKFCSIVFGITLSKINYGMETFVNRGRQMTHKWQCYNL